MSSKSRAGLRLTIVTCAMFARLCGVAGGTDVGAQSPTSVATSVRLERAHLYPLSVTEVRGVRELSDGRVIVLIREPRSMVIFDSSGRTSRAIGRQGDGPREYRSPKLIFPMGHDSSLVADGTTRRWYVLDRDQFVTLRPSEESWLPVLASGVDARGNRLQEVGIFSRDNPKLSWLSDPLPQYAKRIALILRPLAGKPIAIDTLTGQFFGVRDTRATMNRRSTIFAGITNPLQTHDQAVMFPSGEIAIARFSPYRVDWRSVDGSVRRGVSVAEASISVTSEIRRQFAEGWKRNDDGSPVFHAGDFPPWPPVVPPFLDAALVAGTDGLLYITRTRSEVSESLVVDVFDRTTRRIGSAILPGGSRLIAVTRTGWYVAQRNDDDEESLVRYRRRE